MTRLVYMLLVAALAIVGIAMSSHNAAPTAHSTGSAIAAVEAGHEEQHHAAVPAPLAAAGFDASLGADCATCALDPHSAQLIACAFLALMVVTVLLLPRLAVVVPQPAVVLRDAVMRLADFAPAPRPPDLLALGISRR